MSIVNKSDTIIEGKLTVGQSSDGAFPLYVNGAAAIEDNFIVYGDVTNINVSNEANGYFRINSDDGAKTFEIVNSAAKAQLSHPDDIVIKSDETSFLLTDGSDLGGFNSSGLNVTKNADITGRLTVNSGGSNGVGIYGKAIANGWAARYDSNNSNFSGFYFDSNNDPSLILRDDAGNVNVFIKSDSSSYINGGNLGLGTTSPGSNLSSSKVLELSSTGNAEIVLDHTDGGTGSDIGILSFERNGDHLSHIKSTHDGATDSAYISFHAQATGGSFVNAASNEKMRINSSGNVGIGTTSPSYKLSINNGASNASGENVVLKLAGGDDLSTSGDATSIYFASRGSSEFYGGKISLTNTGSSPSYLNPRLDFKVQDNNTAAVGDITTKMSILGNGNVGIGDDAPSYKLDVNGSLRVTSADINFNNLPTSSAGLSSGDLYQALGYVRIVP